MIDLLSVFNELVLMQKSHQHCTSNLCHVEHLSGGCCFRTGPAASSNKAGGANTKPGSLEHFTQDWPFLPPQPIPRLTASTASGGQDGKRQQEALSLLPLQPSSTQTSYTLWYCLWRFSLSLDPEGFPIKPGACRSPGEIPTHVTAQHDTFSPCMAQLLLATLWFSHAPWRDGSHSRLPKTPKRKVFSSLRLGRCQATAYNSQVQLNKQFFCLWSYYYKKYLRQKYFYILFLTGQQQSHIVWSINCSWRELKSSLCKRKNSYALLQVSKRLLYFSVYFSGKNADALKIYQSVLVFPF